MFDINGDFLFDHDLEAGVWDGHSYDCPSPAASCNCDPAAGLAWIDDQDEEQDEEADEAWTDYYEYVGGR